MKQLLLALVIGSFIFSANAEENEQKAERRVLEAVADSVNYESAKSSMDMMKFIVMIDKITAPNGKTTNIQQVSTNFISVEDNYSVIQVAIYNDRLAQNGIGGATVDGSIDHKEQSIAKNGNNILKYSILGSQISAQVQITLLKDSNKVIVMLMPNNKGGDYTLYGELYPSDDTNVYGITPNVSGHKRRMSY
ncbi:MAG: DUF4251 domain-containing protein [Bacteroidales bacterium]